MAASALRRSGGCWFLNVLDTKERSGKRAQAAAVVAVDVSSISKALEAAAAGLHECGIRDDR